MAGAAVDEARPGRRRWPAPLAWLLLVLGCALVLVRTPFLADMSVFLPQDPTPEQRLLIENLRNGALSRTLLIGVDEVPPERQGAFSRALATALRASGDFLVVNDGDPAALEADRKLLFERRYLLSPQVVPARFETAGLHEAIAASIDGLASSGGALLKQLIARDPTGELLAVLARLDGGPQPRLNDGAWVSADGQRVILLATTRASGGDLDAQEALLARTRAAFESVRTQAGADGAPAVTGARLQMTGPGVFAVESRASIRGDVERLSTIGTGLIVMILWLIFRSPVAVGLAIVPMFGSVLAGATAVALVYGSVHGLTVGFGATLVGEAVDYALYHLAGAGRRNDDDARAFRATITLGMLTSIAGFSALLLSGFPGLAQLAVFSISGLLAAVATTRWVLPALTPARFVARPLGGLDLRLARAGALLRGLRWPLTALVLAAVALTWTMAQRGQLWDEDIASLNPVSAASRAIDEQLRTALGAADARTVVAIEAADDEAALQAAEAASERLDAMVGAGELAGYESPATFLPSLRTQQARLQALPAPDVLRDRLQAATAGLPLRAERLAPFVADVAAARDAGPLTREQLAGTALGLRTDALLSHVDGRSVVLLPLRTVPERPLDAAALAARLPGARVLDLKQQTDTLYAGYLREAILLSLAGALAVMLLLAWRIRQPLRVLQVFAPLAGAVLLLTGGFAAAGARMNLLHLVGLLLVVAIGSNYALFFHVLRSSPARSDGTLASLVLANVTTVTGFGMLSMSKVPLLSALGLTVAAGAVLSLLLSFAWIGLPARDADA